MYILFFYSTRAFGSILILHETNMISIPRRRNGSALNNVPYISGKQLPGS